MNIKSFFLNKSRSISNGLIISTFALSLLGNHLYSTENNSPDNKPSISEMKAQREELHKQLDYYKKNNMYPELRKLKTELDSKLKKEDLDKLNALRSKATILRENSKKEITKFAEEHDLKIQDNREKLKDIFESKMDEFKSLAKQLRPIIESNKEMMKEIGKKAQPSKIRWAKDINNIVDTWHSKNEVNWDKKTKNYASKRMEKFHEKMDDMDEPENKMKQAVKFLLWDGSDIDPEEDIRNLMQKIREDFGSNMNKGFEAPDHQHQLKGKDDNRAKNYPNPFSSVTTIEFNLEKAGSVSLSIFDANGNLVSKINNPNMKEGANSYRINGNDLNLQNGTYNYKIEGASTIKTGSFIFNK